MKTSYNGKEYNFNGFDELWAFYRTILVKKSEK
jgi:hypothetical protein